MYSKFNKDKFMEECFAQWLDEHFYPNLNIVSYSRVADAILQKKGVDVIVENTPNSKWLIDEKATLHYINKNIPTFAFEMKNRKSGARGWLFNPDYETSHYVMCWPNGSNDIKSKDDFTSSEIMIMERRKLIDYLASIGLTEEVLNQKIEEYLPQVSRTNFKFELKPGINLFFTEWLYEKPVNIVIRKSILANIAFYYQKIQ